MKIKLTEEEMYQFPWIDDYIDYQYSLKICETVEELEESLDRAINEIEVIYYSNAIKFLQEEDQSLGKSLDIAIEFGYTIETINSELLATLLLQHKLLEELYDFVELIEEKLKY